MWGSYRLATLFGIPILINWSFLALLALVLISTGGLAGVFIVLIAFVGVLVHELGHALMARYLRVGTKEIELGFFGGAAKLTGMPRSAGDEIAIAAAGPAVSLVLSGLGLGLAALTGVRLFALIGWTNLIIGLFNLLPALPMDGGRILRALLSRHMGFLRATELSVKIARGFALVLGVAGLVTGHYSLAILAVMLWLMGVSELFAARFRHYETPFADPWRASAHRAGQPALEVEYLPPGAAPDPARTDDPPPRVFVFRV